jgi:hypothetical protein
MGRCWRINKLINDHYVNIDWSRCFNSSFTGIRSLENKACTFLDVVKMFAASHKVMLGRDALACMWLLCGNRWTDMDMAWQGRISVDCHRACIVSRASRYHRSPDWLPHATPPPSYRSASHCPNFEGPYILEAIVCVEASSTLFHAFKLLQRKDTAQESSNLEDITSVEKESFALCQDHESSTVIFIEEESIRITRVEVDYFI